MRNALLAGLAVATLMVGTARAEDSYMPQCFAPAPKNTKFLTHEKKAGPYRIAFVNGYAGNDWRITAIQSAKAWAARPENAAKLK